MTESTTSSASQLSSTDRDQLLHQIQSLVPVEIASAEIAGRPREWLKVIEPDDLLEKALSRTDRTADELDPFWAATWRAAIGMDRYLGRLNLNGQRMLELGCGSGRAGIAAALHGANVTMTDAAVEGLMVAEWNAWPYRDRLTICNLNWRNETLPQPLFPWIIGSDIVYDPNLWSILEPCIRRHLAPEGTVLLTEPQRQTGDRFLQWVRERGWIVETELIDLEDQQREIRLFRCMIDKIDT